MKKLLLLLISLFNLSWTISAQEPVCSNVHFWYSLSNDSKSSWAVQIARLYENNISFVDESCNEIDLNEKLILASSQTRYVGMKVNSNSGFYATYSFMGVNLKDQNDKILKIPQTVSFCAFFIAPFSAGQDRIDWKARDADCYADHYGTEMHFK